jgi:BirA family biotin operon repressor/biotin-[acetyl-CoA-carboxylase] ligase
MNCPKNFVVLDTVDSTHLYAMRMAESDNVSECVVVAKNQTFGVGRGNRTWISAEGNLFASIIVKAPHLQSDLDHGLELGKISLTVACAVREAIIGYLPDDENVKLHWPNDIYYKNLKISGILLGRNGAWLIISLGVNVNADPGINSATSMEKILRQHLRNLGERSGPVRREQEVAVYACASAVGDNPDSSFGGAGNGVGTVSILTPGAVLDSILLSLDCWFARLEDLGFSHIKRYWLRNVNNFKCNVTIKNGRQSVDGIFQDIDEFGRIVLTKGNDRRVVSSGDLFLNPEGIV